MIATVAGANRTWEGVPFCCLSFKFKLSPLPSNSGKKSGFFGDARVLKMFPNPGGGNHGISVDSTHPNPSEEST